MFLDIRKSKIEGPDRGSVIKRADRTHMEIFGQHHPARGPPFAYKAVSNKDTWHKIHSHLVLYMHIPDSSVLFTVLYANVCRLRWPRRGRMTGSTTSIGQCSPPPAHAMALSPLLATHDPSTLHGTTGHPPILLSVGWRGHCASHCAGLISARRPTIGRWSTTRTLCA